MTDYDEWDVPARVSYVFDNGDLLRLTEQLTEWDYGDQSHRIEYGEHDADDPASFGYGLLECATQSDYHPMSLAGWWPGRVVKIVVEKMGD